jgi:hypothetical protein
VLRQMNGNHRKLLLNEFRLRKVFEKNLQNVYLHRKVFEKNLQNVYLHIFSRQDWKSNLKRKERLIPILFKVHYIVGVLKK